MKSFHRRKEALDESIVELKEKVNDELRDRRFEILEDINEQRQEFDEAYKDSIDADMRNLKAIGEL